VCFYFATSRCSYVERFRFSLLVRDTSCHLGVLRRVVNGLGVVMMLVFPRLEKVGEADDDEADAGNSPRLRLHPTSRQQRAVATKKTKKTHREMVENVLAVLRSIVCALFKVSAIFFGSIESPSF
jgi:hypothetical protein